MLMIKRNEWTRKSLLAVSIALTGCIGYVGGGYDEVDVPVPGVVMFGGEYDRGPMVRGYARRGGESRGFVGHGGGGHVGGGRGGRR